MQDLEATRWSLAARVESCSERLDDAVSELVAVHGLSESEIVARVHEVVRAERRENERHPAEARRHA